VEQGEPDIEQADSPAARIKRLKAEEDAAWQNRDYEAAAQAKADRLRLEAEHPDALEVVEGRAPSATVTESTIGSLARVSRVSSRVACAEQADRHR
jgi:hypothetical protein